MYQLANLFGYKWLITHDGDPRVFALYSRHYSCYQYADNRRANRSYQNRFLCMGPGEKLVLISPCGKAIFGWRKFLDGSGQLGINCAFFRNEGAFDGQVLSSDLILAAEQVAHQKWGGELRFYTYVNTRQVKGDGACFKHAGWQKVGRTKVNNLLILAKNSRQFAQFAANPCTSNLTTPTHKRS